MTEEQILEIGFKKNKDVLTYYMGCEVFMHTHLIERKGANIAHIWIGHSLNFEECTSIYTTVKNIQDLKDLIRIIG